MATSYTLPAVVYNGNNSTVTAYTIPFPFLEPEYVYAAVTTGATTTELDPSAITVTQDEDEQGGTLVTAVAVPTTSTITIFRRTARIQPITYPASGAFPAESHERALDRLTHIAQEINNAVLELQGSAENLEVPTSGGETVYSGARTFLTSGLRDAATPNLVGEIAYTTLTRTLHIGTATTVGAWATIFFKQPGKVWAGGGASFELAFGDYEYDIVYLDQDATIAFSVASQTTGETTRVILIGDGTPRTVTFTPPAGPIGYRWQGSTAPTTVPANGWLVVEITNAGTLSGATTYQGWYANYFSSDSGTGISTLVYKTTSSTSIAIGTGSKVFTVDADLDYVAGDWVSMVSRANPTVNFMIGQVTAYSTTSLTVNVTVVGGSGTKTDWDINLAGRPGDDGAAGTSADNSILGLIEAPTAKTYTVCQYATAAGTIQNLIAKTSSGTLTVAVKINGVDVTGLAAVALTSAESTTAATAANTIAVGDTITVVASAIAAPADLAFVLQIS